MNYKISDLSKMFHVSKEMIRYYEKQGAMAPTREIENNYRQYSIWDIYSFCEFLANKELGIPLKNISAQKNNDYSASMRRSLEAYSEKLYKEIQYKTLQTVRVNELLENIECYEFNEHNFWIKKVPVRYSFHLLSSKGDDYEQIDLPDDISNVLLSPKAIAFLDPVIEFGPKDEWYFSLENSYKELLPQSMLDRAKKRESAYCVCTIVRMGNIGEFSEHCADEALEYINKHNYKIAGPISGLLRGRGIDNGEFIRRMELQIPIETK